MSDHKSAFAAYKGKSNSTKNDKIKAKAKSNGAGSFSGTRKSNGETGKPQTKQNGRKAKHPPADPKIFNLSANRKSAPPRPVNSLDKLVDEIYASPNMGKSKNKSSASAQGLQKKKLEKYLKAKLRHTATQSMSSPNSDELQDFLDSNTDQSFSSEGDGRKKTASDTSSVSSMSSGSTSSSSSSSSTSSPLSSSDDDEDCFSEEYTPNSTTTTPTTAATTSPGSAVNTTPASGTVSRPEKPDTNNNRGAEARSLKRPQPMTPAEQAVPRKTQAITVKSSLKDTELPAPPPAKAARKQTTAAAAAAAAPKKPPTSAPPAAGDELSAADKLELERFVTVPPVAQQDSIEEGKRSLAWLMNPILPDRFFVEFWEKNACLVQRKNCPYFGKLISFKLIDEMLIRNHLEFTTNIDVTSYKDGKRETLNPDGRAMPPTVWGYYGEGCSIRILNPSTYLPGLQHICSSLQEFFHCLVGANVYLTPPHSQGFAPHFDDIEAFVLQVEGRKRWCLYKPLTSADRLARESSGNYKQEQLGKPIFDEVLEPGDVLYFPRGTIHQALTEKNHHSLHITLSVYQKQAYADLLEKLMPKVLGRAISQNIDLRRGVPLNTFQHLGVAHGQGAAAGEERKRLVSRIQQMVAQFLTPSAEEIDAAVDEMAMRFQHEALPPIIRPEELVRTVYGSRSEADEQGKCLCDYELTEHTKIRLLRANIVRLVYQEQELRLYYYTDNALEYCKYEPNFMAVREEEAAAVRLLMHSYPGYITVAKLPLAEADSRIEVATALWERGLLMTEKPFK